MEKELFFGFLLLFCSQSMIIDILLMTLRRNYVVGWQSRSLLTNTVAIFVLSGHRFLELNNK